MTEELERKECKWANALNKLQDQLKFLEKENQTLHEENHKLKLKGVAPKVELLIIRIFATTNIRTTFGPFHEYSNNYSNIFM